MPYYSELGLTSTPSSSAYSSLYLTGPYSKHSSIIASNFAPSYSKSIPRQYRAGYTPHLSTITELNSPLRRLNSPKNYRTSPKVHIRPIKVINTADIDVSVNKYKKFDKYVKVDNAERKPIEKSPSPKRTPESPRSSVGEKEAKPNPIIRRDRATIRLQTVHKDTLEKEIGVIKTWRDNFQPDELGSEDTRRKKTQGEILKEKFLIRSKSKENLLKIEPKITRKKSYRKSPSFHDICKAITCDNIEDELNPGQPEEIQRRQSRHLSSDNLFKEIRRTSTELSVEDLNILDTILSQQSQLADLPEEREERCESVGTARKKKDTENRYNEFVETQNEDTTNHYRKTCLESERKTPSRHHSALKKMRTESSNTSEQNQQQNGALSAKTVRDISQVDIQQTKFKPKPVITSSVDEIEETKPALKAIIQDVEVEESPKTRKEKKFRFNVTVELEDKFVEKRKAQNATATKVSFSEEQKGVVQLPKAKQPVVSNILKKRPSMQQGQILAESQKIMAKKISLILQLPKAKEIVVSNIPKQRPCMQLGQILQEKSKEINVNEGTPKVQIPNTSEYFETQEETPASKILSSNKVSKRENHSAPNLSKRNTGEELNYSTSWSSERKNTSHNHNKSTINKDSNDSDITIEKVQNSILPQSDCSTKSSKNETDETELEKSSNKKILSKRSLVQKANKDDPDLEVFVVPDPESKPEPKPEEQTSDVFVPLQSNRLSQWMHPWKKPEQFDQCPIEIFARPKVIRGRHYPRPRGRAAQPPPKQQSSSEEEEEDSDEGSSSEEEEETSSEEEYDESAESVKIGESTSSRDSGFGSAVPDKNKDCDVNIHKKCEKLTANLCGVNQKLVVEAIESVRKGSLGSRDSPTTNHANNPAFALDSGDIPEEYSQSSTFTGFQKSGRLTPPATTIPRFRKYCVEDFNFLKVLGKGSFGKVLLGELKGTEYYYAIKCLKKDVVLEDDDVECTLIERKVLALGTKHPYLCHLLCTFQTESHLFFVMEYLNGGDLMFHIQASGRFPEHQARFYAAEIVSGLKFLHNKGIVYRDLKLDNILLDFDGHVRIADFGMCKLQIFLDRMAETFCGTPDYMAPEIIKGQHYNQCVDWWSFGVLLYEMLLGQSPFSGCDEDELFWSICNEKPVLPRCLSSEATNILTLLLEKDGNKRLGNRFCPHGDLQDQPFFRSIDWHALEARQLKPPFKPNLQHPLDTQYFDKNFTVEKAKLTPIDSTILQSIDQTQFQGFSYTNPNATDK